MYNSVGKHSRNKSLPNHSTEIRSGIRHASSLVNLFTTSHEHTTFCSNPRVRDELSHTDRVSHSAVSCHFAVIPHTPFA